MTRWTSIVVAGLVLAACGKKAEPAAAPVPTPAPTVSTLVVAYDDVREGLARDDLALAQAKAKALAEGAGKPYPAIVAAAGKVSAMADIEDARLAFGDMSKALIEALAADPKLADNVVAFRCPMAQGYKKWVQIDPRDAKPEMRNPYMGQKMLECGSKTDLAP